MQLAASDIGAAARLCSTKGLRWPRYLSSHSRLLCGPQPGPFLLGDASALRRRCLWTRIERRVRVRNPGFERFDIDSFDVTSFF